MNIYILYQSFSFADSPSTVCVRGVPTPQQPGVRQGGTPCIILKQ